LTYFGAEDVGRSMAQRTFTRELRILDVRDNHIIGTAHCRKLRAAMMTSECV
jgi:hypothetical protein